jgi:two-component system chemotaxis response regulator CheY
LNYEEQIGRLLRPVVDPPYLYPLCFLYYFDSAGVLFVMSKMALVVDDSTSMRQMVAFTLQQAGFSVIEGSDGKDALGKVNGKSVNLVVTDLNMPVMDGISLIKELRKLPNFKFTPILMLTTESQDAKKQEGKSAGATGWLVKPFNPDQLLQVVAKVVH